jgi:hypothetical protein
VSKPIKTSSYCNDGNIGDNTFSPVGRLSPTDVEQDYTRSFVRGAKGIHYHRMVVNGTTSSRRKDDKPVLSLKEKNSFVQDFKTFFEAGA